MVTTGVRPKAMSRSDGKAQNPHGERVRGVTPGSRKGDGTVTRPCPEKPGPGSDPGRGRFGREDAVPRLVPDHERPAALREVL
jgi:hypothetical protein